MYNYCCLSSEPVLDIKGQASLVHPTGDEEVAGSVPAGSGNILSWRLWNIFYSYSFPSADSRRAVVSFWQNNEHKYWLTA